MLRKVIVSLVVLPLLTLTISSAPPTPPSSAEAVLLRRCKAEYRHATELDAPAPGILQDCLVELGDKVKAGQVLGRLQDKEQRAEMERSKFEAESMASVRTAESRYTLARTKHRYARDLFQRNAIGKEEYEVAKQEEETARLALEEVKAAHRVAELRYKQAEVAVRAREIVSPHDGVVVQIVRRPGEAMSSLGKEPVVRRAGEAVSALPKDPIFRVVNAEVLRVTGYLDAGDAWRVHAGQSVCVTPETAGPALPIQSEVFTGQVVFVDSEIDPRTRTCRVVAEVKNRKGLLRAGLDLQMEILLAPVTPAKSAAR
ncbi:MAG TPA: efflux RND transporter periplasmic adaptor subunit [Gemmataceae bacterium]|jgi:RND family efflux transporter MFP subunit